MVERETVDDRGKGERILMQVVEIPQSGLGDTLGWCWIGDVARKVTGRSDGRRIYARCAVLQREGLIEIARRRSDMTELRATARGREVNAILDRIVVARGGRFVPQNQAGILIGETLALR